MIIYDRLWKTLAERGMSCYKLTKVYGIWGQIAVCPNEKERRCQNDDGGSLMSGAGLPG